MDIKDKKFTAVFNIIPNNSMLWIFFYVLQVELRHEMKYLKGRYNNRAFIPHD